MKNLQPYWFLQSPIDAEHKYYVLMDFLQSVEKDLDEKKYSDQIQKITRVYSDLKMFQKAHKLNDKTLKLMTQDELDKMKELVKEARDNDEVEEILLKSIETLDSFIDKIHPYIEEIEKSLSFKIHNEDTFTKDRGYMIIRNNKNKKMKIYSWMFSVIRVDDVDQVGLLLSELMDPLPKYTKSDKKIYDFFSKEIGNFSPHNDCFIIVDLEKGKSEEEISFDLIKERSIEFIVNNYRMYLSLL
jgi:hypothetical protein